MKKMPRALSQGEQFSILKLQTNAVQWDQYRATLAVGLDQGSTTLDKLNITGDTRWEAGQESIAIMECS